MQQPLPDLDQNTELQENKSQNEAPIFFLRQQVRSSNNEELELLRLKKEYEDVDFTNVSDDIKPRKIKQGDEISLVKNDWDWVLEGTWGSNGWFEENQVTFFKKESEIFTTTYTGKMDSNHLKQGYGVLVEEQDDKGTNLKITCTTEGTWKDDQLIDGKITTRGTNNFLSEYEFQDGMLKTFSEKTPEGDNSKGIMTKAVSYKEFESNDYVSHNFKEVFNGFDGSQITYEDKEGIVTNFKVVKEGSGERKKLVIENRKNDYSRSNNYTKNESIHWLKQSFENKTVDAPKGMDEWVERSLENTKHISLIDPKSVIESNIPVMIDLSRINANSEKSGGHHISLIVDSNKLFVCNKGMWNSTTDNKLNTTKPVQVFEFSDKQYMEKTLTNLKDWSKESLSEKVTSPIDIILIASEQDNGFKMPSDHKEFNLYTEEPQVDDNCGFLSAQSSMLALTYCFNERQSQKGTFKDVIKFYHDVFSSESLLKNN